MTGSSENLLTVTLLCTLLPIKEEKSLSRGRRVHHKVMDSCLSGTDDREGERDRERGGQVEWRKFFRLSPINDGAQNLRPFYEEAAAPAEI